MGGSFDSSTTSCSGATGGHRGSSTSPSSGGTRGTGGDERYRQERERQRQEQLEAERRRQEAERQRRKEAERRAFERAKQDALGLLKDSGSTGLKDGADVPALKGGTDFFGKPGNPSGGFKLKSSMPPTAPESSSRPQLKSATPPQEPRFSKGSRHSAPVDPNAGAIDLPPLDPSVFQRPKQRLRIRAVPPPQRSAKEVWLRYVKGTPADLVLDALDAGRGDLDRSVAFLERQMAQHGAHYKAEAALSYLEGLRVSYIAAHDEWQRKGGGKGNATTTIEHKALMDGVAGATRRHWRAPTNPNPGGIHPNPIDWRVQRTERMLDALQRRPGDLMQAFDDLDAEKKDPRTAANARLYLQGVFAYWDFLSRDGGE